MMDASPLIHALIAVVVQATVGLLTRNWWLGGMLACTWWLAREHTQAEYRWIEKFGSGLRASMPQWGGFDPRIWNLPSLLDAFVPVLLCSILYFLNRYNYLGL